MKDIIFSTIVCAVNSPDSFERVIETIEGLFRNIPKKVLRTSRSIQIQSSVDECWVVLCNTPIDEDFWENTDENSFFSLQLKGYRCLIIPSQFELLCDLIMGD